ncbi:TPA: hypothetical protein NGW16_004589 [Vibrio parahaemolyticus]|nr:hypothetical protein [Vibrio parahaemolyticus]
MSWEPGEALLFQQPDTATGLSYHCYFELSEGQTLNGYTWTMTPEAPEQFTITASNSGVTLTADSLAGLFVPEFIDYRDGHKVLRVADWPDLPPGKDLVEFRPSGQSQREYTLTVTVSYKYSHPDTGQEIEGSSSQSWRCVVIHDYSTGRDQLLEYMNASSH